MFGWEWRRQGWVGLGEDRGQVGDTCDEAWLGVKMVIVGWRWRSGWGCGKDGNEKGVCMVEQEVR